MEAAGLYEEALALWHGKPLVDFAGEGGAVAESARLGELRRAALADRADRMLTLGC